MKPSIRSLLFVVPGIAIVILSLSADAIRMSESNGIGRRQIFAAFVGVLLVLVGLVMSRRKHRPVVVPRTKPLSIKKKLFFSCCVGCVTLLLIGALGLYKYYGLYARLSSGEMRGWRGAPHAFDPELGYQAIPDGEGYHTFAVGPDIPMRYDSAGFRVPAGATLEDRGGDGPAFLFLGCSFTYGDACSAEETFVERVGQASGGTTFNAGKCSYGLCQMVILARRLVPELKPDYVVVQYSPWLVDRAMNPFMPTYLGRLSGPYYASNESGDLSIQAPLFRSKVYDLPLDDFKGDTHHGFLPFCTRVVAPLFVHDNWNMACYRAKRAVGSLPAPTTDREEVIRTAYEDILDVCRKNDAHVILLTLGNSAERVEIPESLPRSEALLVDAQEALIDRLQSGQEYERVYEHWRGEPAIKVDAHPNGHAHSIIAEEIMSAVENSR